MKNRLTAWSFGFCALGLLLAGAPARASGPIGHDLEGIRAEFQKAHTPHPREVGVDTLHDWQCQSVYARENGDRFSTSLFNFRRLPDSDVLVYNNVRPYPGRWFPAYFVFMDKRFFSTVPFKTRQSVLNCSGDVSACDLRGEGVMNNMYLRMTDEGALIAEWTMEGVTADGGYASLASPGELATLYSLCKIAP